MNYKNALVIISAVLSATAPSFADARECVRFQGSEGSQFETLVVENSDILIKVSNGDYVRPDGSRPNGTAIYRRANAECNDNGIALRMSDANINFFIEPRSGPVTSVTVFYCEFGGNNNISAQLNPIEYIGAVVDVDGKELEGARDSLSMDFNWVTLTNWGSRGELRGNSSYIQDFVIGGQELYIGRVCFNF